MKPTGRAHGAKRAIAAWIAAGTCIYCNAAAAAEPATPPASLAYPAREIRLIVPFPPGGGNDAIGRIIAEQLQKFLGQAVTVDYRGGGGGTIGTDIAAKSAPDGHTLLINNISLAVNATLFRKLPYDTQKDLDPVSIIGHQPSVLAIYPGLQVKSVPELLELARKTPAKLIYGSGGAGTSSHLATERLQLATQVRMTHVPYKGLGPALIDLAAGKVEMIIATANTAAPHVKAGKIRALAVTTKQRSPLFPQLPIMIEAGVPGFDVSTWYALLVPAGTPRPIISRLNQALARIANTAAVRDTFLAQGIEPDHTSPAQARLYVQSEISRWGKVIKTAGIKMN